MRTNNTVESGAGSPEDDALWEPSSSFFELTDRSLDLLYYAPIPSVLIQADRTIIWRNDAWSRSDVFQSMEIDGEKFRSELPSIESQIAALIDNPDVVSFATISRLNSNRFEARRILVRSGSGWSGSDADSTGACLIFIRPIDPSSVASESAEGIAVGASDLLTNVEMQIVESLCKGRSLREAAEDQGIKYNTARKYLQAIFAKTGVRRQTELIAKMVERLDVR